MNERRKHCRIAGLMVDETNVRVRPGHDGALLNLSPRGALIELRRPMAPGVSVDLQLSRGDTWVTVRALVLRCTVRAIAALEGVTYQAALRFDDACDLPRALSSRNGHEVPGGSAAIPAAHVSTIPEREDSFSASIHKPAE